MRYRPRDRARFDQLFDEGEQAGFKDATEDRLHQRAADPWAWIERPDVWKKAYELGWANGLRDGAS